MEKYKKQKAYDMLGEADSKHDKHASVECPIMASVSGHIVDCIRK